MDIRKVKKLIELLEASDIAEIEIKEGEEAVRISRYSGAAPAIMPAPAAPVAAAPAPAAAAPAPAEDKPAVAANSGHVVSSPMVGTFYRAPAPTSPVAPHTPSHIDEPIDLKQHMADTERSLIISALEQTGWVNAHAATLLTLQRPTLVEKMRKYGIKQEH